MFVIVALIMPMTPPAGIDLGIDNTGIAYAGTIPVDKAHFPDEAFRAFLTKQYAYILPHAPVIYVFSIEFYYLLEIRYFASPAYLPQSSYTRLYRHSCSVMKIIILPLTQKRWSCSSELSRLFGNFFQPEADFFICLGISIIPTLADFIRRQDIYWI